MRTRFPLWLPFAALIWAVLSMGPVYEPLARQPGSVLTSTDEQREEISVTVYQQDLGLVSEVRAFRLQPGPNRVHFKDVARAIDPSSVYIQFLEASEGIKILEREFKYDLLTPQGLLRKYIGQPIELYEKIEGQLKEKVTPAVLLSVGEPNIYQIGDQFHLGHPGRVVVNSLPGGLVTRPTLIWRLKAGLAAHTRCRISYLAQGLSWTADYLATIAPDETTLNLEGWVSIDNQSGTGYEDATLKLIAGQIQRYPGPVRPLGRQMAMLEQAKLASPLQEQPFFEYHLYTIAEPTSLADRHTKQIGLLTAKNIPVQKSYLVENQTPVTQYRRLGPNEHKIVVNTILELVNKKEHNLGIPLPQGKVRMFKYDDKHSLQLIGEDRLGHTPEGEKIRLKVGEASDIVGEYIQRDYKKLRSGASQAEYQLKLRNHKPIPVEVTVVEHPSGDWRITESSVPFTKKDFRTAETTVEIPAKGEESINYTIRVKR